MSRIPYIFLFLAASLFAITMSLYGEKQFGLKFYHQRVCHVEQCEGNGSVFRVSLCLFLFEAVHAVIVSKAPAFHHSFFQFKVLCFVAMVICSFLSEGLSPWFDDWAEAARFFSGLYLFIQILLFLTWSYDLSELLMVRGDELHEFEEEHGFSHKCCCGSIPGNRFHWTLGIVSVGSLLASFVCLGALYPLFDSNDSNPHCAVHESVTSVTIIVAALTATFSVVRGDGSFGVAAMCSLYATFLLFTAMNADPDPEGEASCKPFPRHRDGASLWIGFLITLASVCYAALRADTVAILGNDSVSFASESSSSDDKADPLLDGQNVGDTQLEIKSDAEENDESDREQSDDADAEGDHEGDDDVVVVDAKTERRTNVHFHVVMMLASAYIAMLFTNWGTNKTSIATTGTISFAVGVCSSWTVFAVYWWTICAPRLFPGRFEERNED